VVQVGEGAAVVVVVAVVQLVQVALTAATTNKMMAVTAALVAWAALAASVGTVVAAVVGLVLRWFVSARPRQRFHKPPSTRAPAVQQGRAPCQVCQV